MFYWAVLSAPQKAVTEGGWCPRVQGKLSLRGEGTCSDLYVWSQMLQRGSHICSRGCPSFQDSSLGSVPPALASLQVSPSLHQPQTQKDGRRACPRQPQDCFQTRLLSVSALPHPAVRPGSRWSGQPVLGSGQRSDVCPQRQRRGLGDGSAEGLQRDRPENVNMKSKPPSLLRMSPSDSE